MGVCSMHGPVLLEIDSAMAWRRYPSRTEEVAALHSQGCRLLNPILHDVVAAQGYVNKIVSCGEPQLRYPTRDLTGRTCQTELIIRKLIGQHGDKTSGARTDRDRRRDVWVHARF